MMDVSFNISIKIYRRSLRLPEKYVSVFTHA